MLINNVIKRLVPLLVVIFGSTLIVSLLLQLLPVGLKDLYVSAGDEASVKEQLE